MPELLTSSLLALNPRADILQYLTMEHHPIEFVIEQQDVDLKDYYITSYKAYTKNDLLKEELKMFFNSLDEDLKIGQEVFNNSLKILDDLYPSLSQELNTDNLYPTNYGTVIMDWEKGNGDILSLEIGSTSLGYFIEKNGRDIKQVDEKEIVADTLEELFTDLETFIEQ